MGTFRRVEGNSAGPRAVGILIPPARQTFLILRPRSLPWDLLLCRDPDTLAFAQLSHDEASAAAQGLYRALREWASGGPGGFSAHSDSRLRLMVGTFVLVVCPRTPGQPYAPLQCDESESSRIALILTDSLCPQGSSEQELYFNTRFFER